MPKFPTDTAGFLYALKHQGLRAIEKQYGSPERHEVLLATLKELHNYAKVRYKIQKQARDKLKKELSNEAQDSDE